MNLSRFLPTTTFMSLLLSCRLLVPFFAFATATKQNPNSINPNNYYAKHDRHLQVIIGNINSVCNVCSDANKQVSKPTSLLSIGNGAMNNTCGEWQRLGATQQLNFITCFNVQYTISHNSNTCACVNATKSPTSKPTTALPTNKPTTAPPTKSPTRRPTLFPTNAPSLSKAPSGAPTASPTRCFSPFFLVSYYGEPIQRLTCDEDTIIYNNVAGQNVTVALSLDDPSLVADSASVQLALDGVTTSVEGVVADDPYKFYGLLGERNDGNGFFKDWTNFAQNQTYVVTASLWNNAGAVVAEFDIIIHIM